VGYSEAHMVVVRLQLGQLGQLRLCQRVIVEDVLITRHPFRKRMSSAYKARVFATGTISSFFATNMPNPLL
jgi:hypothetical protein